MSKPTRRNLKPQANAVAAALKRSATTFYGVGVFSGVINVLALTGSIYMLQVYDRVLTSRSVPTLVGLTVLMAGLYIAYGLLDFFRVRVMGRVGLRIDQELSGKVFDIVRLLPLRARYGGDGMQPVRDLDQIRSYMSGLGPTALFDLPWIPVYLAVVFLLHPILGLFATAGALILVGLTFWTEVASSGPLKSAAQSGSQRLALGEAARRNAEVIRAMGLGERIGRRWHEASARHLVDQVRAADAASGVGTLTKILRLLLQSGILGLGAYLVLEGQVTPGTIIAGSITMSRALAPIESAITHWRSFVSARHSYRRLVELFTAFAQESTEVMSLPKPTQTLTVQNLVVAPPGQSKPTVVNVNLQLNAGDGLGIIGPSASGKSTLARALVGVWAPSHEASAVRLDGAALDQWAPDTLGRYIGYLPQDIELFDGTVAENIARFDENATAEAIVAAARDAGCHEMIVHLPEGYQTRIGEAGQSLSAGQRQRLALARALYGEPFLVVLDEPNSNLDAVGDSAVTDAIRSVRRRGGIAIVIAHRPSALAGVDAVLAMANGQTQALGPRDEVLRKIVKPAPVRGGPPPMPQRASAGGAATATVVDHPGLKVVVDSDRGDA